MNKNTLKFIIISVIILVSASIILLIIFHFNKSKEYNHLKNYSVNEYIPTYVSNEDMAKIYLNDFAYNIRYNVKNSYELLDDKYKEAKFNSFNDYLNYIKNFKNKRFKLERYSKYTKDKYLIYKIYDEDGNVFIFKTDGVMQYKVYLDEYTVEVGE